MKKILLAFMVVAGLVYTVPAAQAMPLRQLCDNGNNPKTDRVFTFTHNGDNFKPRFQIKYQTGNWCNLTGDYVWTKFIYNTQPGDSGTYPVVNQNSVAKKIEFASLLGVVLLNNTAEDTLAFCDMTPGDDHEDGEGCDNTAWVQNPGQHGEVGKTQSEKYNCDANGPAGGGELFNGSVVLRIYWDDGTVSPWYQKEAFPWNSNPNQCSGFPPGP